MPAARRSIEVAVPPERLLAVITDFPSYPSFLPEMESTEVLKSAAAEWDVRFTLKVIRRFVYTLRLVQESPTRVRWSLVDGSFKANDGGWTLAALDGGRRTHATYEIDLQVGMFVPGNIMRSLVDRSLPDTLERFKGEAERRG